MYYLLTSAGIYSSSDNLLAESDFDEIGKMLLNVSPASSASMITVARKLAMLNFYSALTLAFKSALTYSAVGFYFF